MFNILTIMLSSVDVEIVGKDEARSYFNPTTYTTETQNMPEKTSSVVLFLPARQGILWLCGVSEVLK